MPSMRSRPSPYQQEIRDIQAQTRTIIEDTARIRRETEHLKRQCWRCDTQDTSSESDLRERITYLCWFIPSLRIALLLFGWLIVPILVASVAIALLNTAANIQGEVPHRVYSHSAPLRDHQTQKHSSSVPASTTAREPLHQR